MKGIIWIALLPAWALAVNYAVGPTRNYTQLSAVANLLNPGDTVFVDGNATYTGGVRFTRSGDSARPIVIRGLRVSGQRPIVQGATNTVELAGNHTVFEGFEVTGGSFRCIYHHAHNIVVRDVAVHDCPAHGILGADQGSGSLLLEYSEVYRCGSGSSQHQIYMTTDQVAYPGSVFRMQFCYLHDATGGNNVKSRSERNEIYYNWIEGAYYHELELIGPDPDGVASEWTPRLKREDSDVVGNVFRKKRTAAGNDSNFAVFRIGGDATGESHGRYRFVNNTILAGTGAVFRCFDSLESVEMHNNVFHRPGGGLNLMRAVVPGEAQWTQGTAIIAGSQNWYTTGAANVPATWTGSLTGADPGFVNLSTGDLRPTASSPLLNAGAASVASAPGYAFPNPLFPPTFRPPLHAPASSPIARMTQGALDIGAFEHESGSSLFKVRHQGAFTPRSNLKPIDALGRTSIGEGHLVSPNAGLLSPVPFSHLR